jgi:hypothetical protein
MFVSKYMSVWTYEILKQQTINGEDLSVQSYEIPTAEITKLGTCSRP